MLFAPWKIPVLVTRPWRLVRELDGFSDEDCRAYAERVVGVRVLALLIAGGIALVLGMTITLVGSTMIDSLGRRSAWGTRESIQGRALMLCFGASMIAVTVSCAFAPYGAMLRAALKHHIARAVCPSCQYSLLGLPTVGGANGVAEPEEVVCPECGMRIELSKYGLRPSDIIAGSMQSRSEVGSAAGRGSALRAAVMIGILIGLGIWVATGSGIGVAIAAACVYASICVGQLRSQGRGV